MKFKNCCGALSAVASAPVTVTEPDQAGLRTGGGDAANLVDTGLQYLTAAGVPYDAARGVSLIESAAHAGDARGAFLAATIASSYFWRERDWNLAFDYLLQAAQLGHTVAQDSLRILAGGPSGKDVTDDTWQHMRSAIDLAEWLEPPPATMLRESPCIQVIEGFAPPAACDWLVAQAKQRLSRASIYDRTTGKPVVDDRRTNSQCDLGVDNSGPLTFVLRGRIGALTRRHDRAMEIPKVLHYAPGETFAPHYDFLDASEPAYGAELAEHGQRTHTFLLYLNDEFRGGETRFLEIDLAHIGAKGDALLFANVGPDGQPDYATKHAGLPPTSGEKWVFSQWIREYPRE